MWLEHVIEMLVGSEASKVQVQQRLIETVYSLALRIIYVFKYHKCLLFCSRMSDISQKVTQ